MAESRRRGIDSQRRLVFEVLEDRQLLAVDFGDAPDLALGTGAGDYRTLANDNGARHTIVAGLHLGASVDGIDGGVLQNVAANADDVNGALPDDEDGVANPAVDLKLTISTTPSVRLWTTNTTGGEATLYGWIDYDSDGNFDNVTERASIVVPSSAESSLVTLTFPGVPNGFHGETYARFRLSTDSAAATSTGAAADGEVEDYRVEIVAPSHIAVDRTKTIRIASGVNGLPLLAESDGFGDAVAAIGDLDGDGVGDLAVGATQVESGAVFVLFMNPDGTVRDSQRISEGFGGGPELGFYSFDFGSEVEALGDLDGDGRSEIAVTTEGNEALYVLFLNADGTARRAHLAVSFNGIGRSVTALGDIDGDGVPDLATGSYDDDTEEDLYGMVHILLMNTDGSVKNEQRIGNEFGGGPSLLAGSHFGSGLAALGDLDGDGIAEIAVGASGHGTVEEYGLRSFGAVFVLFMNADGTAKSYQEIASNFGGGPELMEGDRFGSTLASLGDVDGDGVNDLGVAALYDDSVGGFRGGVYVVLLNADGSAKEISKIAAGMGGGPAAAQSFGHSVASVGDVDGDGRIELAVGGTEGGQGSVYILTLLPTGGLDYGDAPDGGAGSSSGNYQTLLDDGGPSHVITLGIRLGAALDGEDGALEDGFAVADDIDGALPNDEDGLLDPASDLAFVIGAQPTIAVQVTNRTGRTAMLYGWIDYNTNGVFENATERATAMVADGTNSGTVELVFPQVPRGFSGTTYMRLRLSTDDAAAEPTGAAWDGEVEDYRANITDLLPLIPLIDPTKTTQIASGIAGGPWLGDGSYFGGSIAALGDLDSNGVVDLAVGAPGQNTGSAGEAFVLLMNSDGSVMSAVPMSGGDGGIIVGRGSHFGSSVASLPDMDGDHIGELLIGATGEEVEGAKRGAVHLIFLNSDGTAKKSLRIAGFSAAGIELEARSGLGSALASLGDIDGDSVPDIAVGAAESNSVYVLMMNANGTIKSGHRIRDEVNRGSRFAYYVNFGRSLAVLDDSDGNGVAELVVGAPGESSVGYMNGAAYILYLNSDGALRSSRKIAPSFGGGPEIEYGSRFGRSLASLGDINRDGVADLAVGTGSLGSTGTVYLMLMNADGTAKGYREIGSGVGGVPTLPGYEQFAESIAFIGDLDGDGIANLAVGTPGDQFGASGGSLFVFSLEPTVLAGDYNRDSGVDAADYSIWRNAMGQTGLASYGGADGDGEGTVNQNDYLVWKANFGRVIGAGSRGHGAGSGLIQVELQEEGVEHTFGETSSGTRSRAGAMDGGDDLLVRRWRGLWALGLNGEGGRATMRPPAEPGAGELVQASARLRDLGLLAWRSSSVPRLRGLSESGLLEIGVDRTSPTRENVDSVFEEFGLGELSLRTR